MHSAKIRRAGYSSEFMPRKRVELKKVLRRVASPEKMHIPFSSDYLCKNFEQEWCISPV